MVWLFTDWVGTSSHCRPLQERFAQYTDKYVWLISKGHQLNEWRLIVDLSFPKDHSVNDRVPKHLCSLSYITSDDTIDTVCKFRLGTHLAKLYRYQEDVPPTACTSCIQTRKCLGVHTVDTCLSFGLQSALKLFNLLADFLSWIVNEKSIVHYSLRWLSDHGSPSILSLSAQFGSRWVVLNCEAKKKQQAHAYSGQCDHYSELFTQMVGLSF